MLLSVVPAILLVVVLLHWLESRGWFCCHPPSHIIGHIDVGTVAAVVGAHSMANGIGARKAAGEYTGVAWALAC